MLRPKRLSRASRPSGRALRRTSLGLLVGAVGGWVAGLLKAPNK